MLNKLTLSFVSFLSGIGVMTLVYDYQLFQSEVVFEIGLIKMGTSFEIGLIVKIFMTLIFIASTISLIIFKEEC